MKNENVKLKQLKQSELKSLRIKLFNNQNGICPILKTKMDFTESVIDHKHKTKNEKIGDNGKGLVRGCIHRCANTVEGKISNSYRRYGIEKMGISLPEFLRNMADYIENKPYIEDDCYLIHPNEAPKRKILTKTSYNKLKKEYNEKAKFPKYKTRNNKPIQILTKPLDRLFKKYGIIPKFYK